jgi:hypothetical protein
VEGGDPPELHCGLVVVRRVCLVWPKREDVSLNESLLSLILNQSVRTRDDECVMIPFALPEMGFSLVVQPHLELQGLTAG